MIKMFCDLCGGEIVNPDYQTCLSLNSFGVSRGPTEEYQLHADCAWELKKRLEVMLRFTERKPKED